MYCGWLTQNIHHLVESYGYVMHHFYWLVRF